VNLADVQFAPRIDPRILRALAKLDDPGESIAECRRRIGEVASELGLPRPSYERVRQLVHVHRCSRSRPGHVDALLDLALYTRPPQDVLADFLTGEASRHR
jgi:hypothetical protein